MIEALYQKNRTYLSLSSANAEDLQAIMKDHYEYISIIENDPADSNELVLEDDTNAVLNSQMGQSENGCESYSGFNGYPVSNFSYYTPTKKIQTPRKTTEEITSQLSEFTLPVTSRKSTGIYRKVSFTSEFP